MEDIARELAVSWQNGNLTDTVDAIAGQGTKRKAALLAVLVYGELIDTIDKRAFLRLLAKES